MGKPSPMRIDSPELRTAYACSHLSPEHRELRPPRLVAVGPVEVNARHRALGAVRSLAHRPSTQPHWHDR
eukprot:756256-Hanusia_phi.AAC.8